MAQGPRRCGTVLMVEDVPGDAAPGAERLRRAGFDPVVAAASGMGRAPRPGVGLLVLAHRPGGDGAALGFYERLRAEGPAPPALLLTGPGDEPALVRALRAGIADALVARTEADLDALPAAAGRLLAPPELPADACDDFRVLAEALPQLVWVTHPEGGNEYVNSQWASYTGLPRERFAGWGWTAILHPGDRDRCLDLWARAREAGRAYEIEYRLRGADGSYRWFLGRALPLRDDAGRVVKWFGTCTDIDDQKRAEGALQRWEQVFRHAGWGIGLVDPRTGTLLSVNASFAVKHGYQPGEVLGRPLADFFAPGARTDFADHERQADARGHHVYESLHVRKDGTVFPVQAEITSVKDDSGRVLYRAVNVRNLTERMLAEQALRAAKEAAEAAGRAKDHFLAMLSHELRTPLTPILLAVSSMLDDDGPPPGDVRPTLEMVRRNVELEARLIDDLLDITRIARGRMDFHWEVGDAHETISRALALCRDEAGAAGLALDVDLSAADRHLRSDPARLQQVVWNLVKNAIKFTPRGGSISVRTRNVPGDDGPPTLLVEVADTGVGIAPEVLPRIFNAFEQGEATRNRRFGGLGLGLAIGRSIAEAHGGALEARSPGRDRGATFLLTLPTAPAPSKTPAPDFAPAPAPSAPPGLRILLVEDDEPTRRVLAKLLNLCGHAVTPAGRISQALEAAVAGDFDLLISDLGLPDGSGLDLMRRLSAGSGRPLPSVALSGFGREADVRESREAGFLDHLTKPVDFATLHAVVRRIASESPQGLRHA